MRDEMKREIRLELDELEERITLLRSLLDSLAAKANPTTSGTACSVTKVNRAIREVTDDPAPSMKVELTSAAQALS